MTRWLYALCVLALACPAAALGQSDEESTPLSAIEALLAVDLERYALSRARVAQLEAEAQAGAARPRIDPWTPLDSPETPWTPLPHVEPPALRFEAPQRPRHQPDALFAERYQRPYNIWADGHRSDNPRIWTNDPDSAFNPVNRFDPANPCGAFALYNEASPCNPMNASRSDNPANPMNRGRYDVPFQPLK